MKKGKKLALLLGAATLSLTGCSSISEEEYLRHVYELETRILEDMKEVGLDIYKYEIQPYRGWELENYYTSQSNNGNFLYFPNNLIISDVSSGKESSLVVYSITNSDVKDINNLRKSARVSQSSKVDYYGAIEGLIKVIEKDTSKLYSVKNLTTNTILYSAENQNEMTDNGMEM